jgi:PAS domain S-box-containing protein
MSEERLRTFMETATDAIITMGPEGRVLTFNRAAERMFGYPAEAMIGRSIDPLIPEEYADRHRAGLRRYLETGESTVLGRTVELEGRRRNGETFPIELSLSVARAGGDLTFGATIRDIGERKRAEEALREQEARYRTLFEQSPDGIVAFDPETTLPIDFNGAAHRQLGYSREEFARLRIRDYEILETEADTRARIERLLREGGEKFETRHRTKAGEIRDVIVNARVITMGGRQVLHAVFQDVTEPKRTAEALRQSEKLAAMGELLAGVAHELNNPLAVVMGRATMLRDKVAGSELAEGAEKLRQAAERCARIVKNFLALARQHPPERDQVELNRIVIEAVELLAYPLRVDSVDVSLSLASDLPILAADPHQLHQVLVNLITNAHHAMREAPLPRRLAISTRLDPDPRRVQLEVADNGPGIPAHIQSRIFEPFFTTKPVGQGTGLGLPLCKGIIEGHGGMIRAGNRSEGGAAFVVELPLGTPARAARAAGSASPITGRLILVVDDEPDVAAVLAEILAADGHQVETAASGLVALEKLRVRPSDVILLDLKMPGLDGPGLYRDIARQHPDLRSRVAFVTGDTMNPDTSAFLEETGAPTLAKPFTVEDVRRVVRQVVS